MIVPMLYIFIYGMALLFNTRFGLRELTRTDTSHLCPLESFIQYLSRSQVLVYILGRFSGNFHC